MACVCFLKSFFVGGPLCVSFVNLLCESLPVKLPMWQRPIPAAATRQSSPLLFLLLDFGPVLLHCRSSSSVPSNKFFFCPAFLVLSGRIDLNYLVCHYQKSLVSFLLIHLSNSFFPISLEVISFILLLTALKNITCIFNFSV